MAAYAALVSLMNNVEQIQSHTRLPIHFDQKQSESLLEKVSFLIEFLESYNYHAAGEKMKDLESRIRDAAYAAEDIIETHVVDTIDAHSRSNKKENEIISQTEENPTLTCLQGIEKVLEDMEFLMEEAMKMKYSKEVEMYPRPSNPIAGPLISSAPFGNNTTVGFDDELKRLVERLLSSQHSRQVIPIVGMGGIGKTTLAKTAYEKPFIGRHFDFCAWVSISQEYDLKKIILGLLPNESSQMSGNELGQRLHQKLHKRRYLVVLDDMWTVEAWEMVQLFLPDNRNGSRIIVTTRESSVSTCFGSPSLDMSFLDEDQSWNLFCKQVFTAKGCPHELEEVGRKIVKNCKGLPLSIVVIGGLLSKSEMRKEYWEYIAQDTNTIINSAEDEQCMKILSLSYQNLPIHLKPCFLYVAAFPEDKEISATMLINLWVAEGFLKSKCSNELEELAETYLNDFISRNLIIIRGRRRNGKVKSCMVHDLLRDFCLKVVRNEKFMYTSNMSVRDEVQFTGSQRRISFHNPVLSSSPQVRMALKSGYMPLVRTLICSRIEEFPLQNFRLLRVLNYGVGFLNVPGFSINDIFLSVNSRFIRTGTHGPTRFPSSICLSWNLQILIIWGLSEKIIAPLEIWEMTELRNLQFRRAIYLPDPPPSQQMNTQEGGIMKKLHTLKGVREFRLTNEVAKRIPNIKKLTIWYYLEVKGLIYGILMKLESLSLHFNARSGSDLLSCLTFPNSLKKLKLCNCSLHWEHMSIIASLPNLEILKLFDAIQGPSWVLDEEVFHCLKSLSIDYCPTLAHWIAEDTHCPCLEHLRLDRFDQLEEIPSSIGDTLRTIDLRECSISAVISAKKILDEQEEFGNVGLQVSVLCDRDDGLERLASENFLIVLNLW